MIRVGVVCSSGGSVFSEAYKILNASGYDVQFNVVTDRPCGAENICDELGIPWCRIDSKSRTEFSIRAANWLYAENRVDWTVLFFSRLVSSDFFSKAPCINFHPSLLPAFPGFGALKEALRSRARFMGTTAHRVDDSMDNGPILAQTISPILNSHVLQDIERISFAQKLYLLLLMFELAERGELIDLYEGRRSEVDSKISPWANPSLRDHILIKRYEQFLEREGIRWQY